MHLANSELAHHFERCAPPLMRARLALPHDDEVSLRFVGDQEDPRPAD